MVLLLKREPLPESEKNLTLKPLLWPAERAPLLTPWYLDLAEQLALRQMRSLGQVLGSLLPLGLRSGKLRFELRGDGKARKIDPKSLFALNDDARAELAAAWLEGRMRAVESRREPDIVCQALQEPPWPLRPAARRQIEAMELLWERGGMERKLFLKTLGAGGSEVMAALAAKGLVSIGPRVEEKDAEDPELLAAVSAEDGAEGRGPEALVFNEEQAQAYEMLRDALDARQGGARLLFGVTGSGKTAVYLALCKHCLESGRSAYLLAPEIALAMNLYKAARAWFPELAASGGLHFSHGSQSPQKREATFRAVAEATAPVLVVGARSALFLPVLDPGLVVLDEEHDAAFKQDERLNYQAKEIGWHLARRSRGLLVLGSATPDVKTYYAAEQGLAPAARMTRRAAGNELPAMRVVDIRGQSATEQLLAEETIDALKATIARGEQAIILINRRGYAPLMYCLDCGTVAKCPECEIGLTYHKARERLVCHYCGLSRPFPLICNCGGSHYLPMGEGAERLEESLSTLVPPTARVLRLDRDTTRSPGRLEGILGAFGRGEAQLMVGTQMLAKGHHFPQVTNVVVADADLGLHLPDYRAMERAFQLLVQVAGRAGRGEKPGEVFIQTRDPSHPCWAFVRENDYLGFYHAELEVRRKRRYPPFVKLGLLRVQHAADWEEGARVLGEIAKCGREAGRELGVQFLGPAPAPLRMLRGWKRFHCLLKAEGWPAVRATYGRILERLPVSAKLRISLDLDPVDML
jgi:primosomal protein N' (replication factor Y)